MRYFKCDLQFLCLWYEQKYIPHLVGHKLQTYLK